MGAFADLRARRAETRLQRTRAAELAVYRQQRRGRMTYERPGLFGYDAYVEFWIPRAWYLRLVAAKSPSFASVAASVAGDFWQVPQDAWVELTDLSDDLLDFNHPANIDEVDPTEVRLRVLANHGVESQIRVFSPLCGGPGVVARYLVWRSLGGPEA